ncbi:MAG: hypothetical protein ACFE8E_08520 [Candidatus Hodarchaeota archaeon]
MSSFKNEKTSNNKPLNSYLKSEIIKNAKKLKTKYPPISETREGVTIVLRIENLYELSKEYRNFYLIKTRNYQNNPKFIYFLAVILAFQSSDFLVILAKTYLHKNIKLIQFSIHPKNLRISLLALKEIKTKDEFQDSVKTLKDLRINFRKKLTNIKNQL